MKLVRTLILIAGFKLVLLWVCAGRGQGGQVLQKSKKSRWQSAHEQGKSRLQPPPARHAGSVLCN